MAGGDDPTRGNVRRRYSVAGVFVRRFDLALRVPDALHLAIVRRLGVALVTLDRRLATAAGEFGVAAEMPKMT